MEMKPVESQAGVAGNTRQTMADGRRGHPKTASRLAGLTQTQQHRLSRTTRLQLAEQILKLFWRIHRYQRVAVDELLVECGRFRRSSRHQLCAVGSEPPGISQLKNAGDIDTRLCAQGRRLQPRRLVDLCAVVERMRDPTLLQDTAERRFISLELAGQDQIDRRHMPADTIEQQSTIAGQQLRRSRPQTRRETGARLVAMDIRQAAFCRSEATQALQWQSAVGQALIENVSRRLARKFSATAC